MMRNLKTLKQFLLSWDRQELFLVATGVLYLVSGMRRQILWQAAMLLLAIIFMKYRSYRLLQTLFAEEKKHDHSMAELQLRTLEALALAIEAKDPNTREHLLRVQIYAVEIGKELGLSASDQQALRAAALLHDIGKIAVPEHIISKPGKLTPEEFEKMKIHPTVGAEILAHMKLPYPVVPIVLAHHERWNGTGYPNGLKGEEIPLGARILAVVDCLDALASDRQYRRALPLHEAMERVAAEAGTSYDPSVVEVLQRRYRDLERMTRGEPARTSRLSTNVKVAKGLAPATGLEPAPSSIPEAASLPFLNWISSARQEAQLLQELTSDLGNTLSLEENLSLLALRLKRMAPYDALAVYVRSDDHLSPVYTAGEFGHIFGKEIPLGRGLTGWVAEHNKAILNGNPAVEPGYVDDPGKFNVLRSALAIPLPGASGVVNVLALYQRDKDAFSRDHLRILLAISSKVGLTIENAMKFEHVESSAGTDFLTNLPNARSLFTYLDKRVAEAKRRQTSLAVIVGDLDGFKQVNDRFGHLVGNKVLRLVAARLKQACRESDYVARMGGDEFVLVLPCCTQQMIESRLGEFQQIVEQAGLEVCKEPVLSISFGMAAFPEQGVTGEQLLADADSRMYTHKREHQRARHESALVALDLQQDLIALNAAPGMEAGSPVPLPE